MKSFVIVVCITFIASLSATAQSKDPFFTTDTIPTADAIKHIGKYFTFCDEITAINTLSSVSGKPTMVSLGMGADALAMVFWQSDIDDNFGKPIKELYPVGTKICAQGQISDHGGSPRLEIGSPNQIRKVE